MYHFQFWPHLTSDPLPLAERWLSDPRWKGPKSQHSANVEDLCQVRNTHFLWWEMNFYCLKSPRSDSFSVPRASTGSTKTVPIRHHCLLSHTLLRTSATSLGTCVFYQPPFLPLTRHCRPKVSKWLHVLNTQKSKWVFKKVRRLCLPLASAECQHRVHWDEHL